VEVWRNAWKNSFRRIKKVTPLDAATVALLEGSKSTVVTCATVADARRING
jgi:hypothetical protein